MTSDQDERDRALDPARSFIIDAPAGSGKTGLLTQRYLSLLSVVNRPESIIAMTFTRKAAAEMKQRIHDALLQAELGSLVTNEYELRTRQLASKALERGRQKDWNLLTDTGRLQIQTIDALCAMLTRHMPVVSAFGGQVEVVEDPADLYRLAARRTLQDLTEGGEMSGKLFREVSLYFDNNMAVLEMQIARMLQKRDQWAFLKPGEHPHLINAFCELLHRAEHALKDVFRQSSKVDFTEVTRAAITALGTPAQPSDLLYWLDYRIEHLLVDEFQDTSRAQFDLIDKLTGQWSEGDERTLFVVGDPMQSIYRFREADVSLFLRCWDDQQLGSVRLNRIRLEMNFRCTPYILQWIEAKFDHIMPEDDAKYGAVRFRRSQASRQSEGRAKPETKWFIGDDGQNEAKAVVGIIERAKKKGSVAVLVRSRSHIVSILPALREAGISYEAIEIDELKEQQHIIDLISLTRALVQLGDRVSWLACLRAPWCGLTLADLSALAEKDPNRTILDLLSDQGTIARLSSDGRSRAVRLQEILSSAIAHVARMSLRDLVERTWMALGGPAILRDANQFEDVDTYLDLLEKFEEGGTVLDFSLLNQRLEFLYAKPSVGEHRVQVMTIHEAKGLEFDAVIIPQLGRQPRQSERELLIWTEETVEDGGTNLLIAAQPQRGEDTQEYAYVLEAIKKKEEHELKRLFYVACTRAKNALYLFGSLKAKNGGKECSEAAKGSFLKLIWNSVKPEFESELRKRPFVQGDLFARNGGEQPKTIIRRLPAAWRAPHLDRSVQWSPEFHRAAASARKITYEWVGNSSRHVGTVVHELLKQIARQGTAGWTVDRVARSTKFVRSELLRLGVPHSQEPKASAQVIQAVSNTLTSRRGRWILDAHLEARSEWAIGGRINELLVTGTIDRMFRDEQGRLWIVDFKTSQHEGGRLEAFLDEEQRRYRAQLESYAILISRLSKGPLFLGLYFPLLDGWREWAFVEEGALVAY